jgi:hypothetical protein
LICSALVAQAVAPPGAEEDDAATAGVLLLAGALGLAVTVVVEPPAAGWLLPEDAHPASATAPVSAPAARAALLK